MCAGSSGSGYIGEGEVPDHPESGRTPDHDEREQPRSCFFITFVPVVVDVS